MPLGRCGTGPAGTGRRTAYSEDRDRSGDGGARSRRAGWEDYGCRAGTQCGARAAGGGGRRARRRGGSGPSRRIRFWATDTVVRQQLELRQAAAEQAVGGAQQRIEAALAGQKLVEAVSNADRELRDQQAKANSALETASNATAKQTSAENDLRRCDVLERALDVHAADKQAADAQAAVDKAVALKDRLEATSRDRGALAGLRASITVPVPSVLGPMRKLANELAAARGALDVGFVVTVAPKAHLNLRVLKDGQEVAPASIAQPVDIEAKAEVQLAIGDIATVLVRGGRREAQEEAKDLEARWSREVEPHLVAAGVADLIGLDAKNVEAQELDAGIKTKDAEMESLGAQIAALGSVAEALRVASERAATCRTALGDTELDTLAADLKALGADATAGLRKRRQQLLGEAEAARTVASQAANDRTLADERTRHSRLALDTAVAARDAALTAFPAGVDAALVAARAALAAGVGEKEQVTAEFACLESAIDARKKRTDEALSGARTKAAQAAMAVEAAQGQVMTVKTKHASDQGRLIDCEDSATARISRPLRPCSVKQSSLTRPCMSQIGSSPMTRSAPPGMPRPA